MESRLEVDRSRCRCRGQRDSFIAEDQERGAGGVGQVVLVEKVRSE